MVETDAVGWLLGAAVAGAVLLLAAPRLATFAAKLVIWFRARRHGPEELYGDRRVGTSAIGRFGRARTELAPRGKVVVQGEIWHAVAVRGTVAAGEPVEVLSVDGLLLTVRSTTEPKEPTT